MSQPDSPLQYAFALEFSYSSGISRVLVYVDHPRHRVGRGAEDLSKEALRSCRVASGREQEINGLPCRIDSAIQVLLLTLHLDISLIHPVALPDRLQMWTASLAQLGGVRLDPAPDAASIHGQSSLRQQVRHMPVGQGVSQIPTYRREDDFC